MAELIWEGFLEEPAIIYLGLKGRETGVPSAYRSGEWFEKWL